MPTFRIRGEVYPTGIKVNVPRFDLLWTEGTGQVPIQFLIQIDNSQIDIECVAQIYDPLGDHSTYTTRALELTRAIVDPIAFSQGVGFSVMLNEIVTPAGVVKKIVPKNEKLMALCSAFRDFDVAQRLIISEPLYLAMNDLIVAITLPGQIPLNCGRAIESLRRIMVPVDPDRKLGWPTIRSALNLTQSYVEFITKASSDQRHGCRSGIPSSTAQEILERSWTIMNRFVEYRKRDSTSLPLSDFPLLS